MTTVRDDRAATTGDWAATPYDWPGVAGTDVGELAVVTRSGFVESRHFGHAVVVDPAGAVVATVGSPDTVFYPRSSAKPFQAAAVLLAGAELADERLAIASASHLGHPDHRRLVAALLDDVGLGPDDLQCPPALPSEEWARHEVLRANGHRERLAMNCSGKHAGMLAACVAAGWDTTNYRDPQHPLQRLARRVVEVATDVAVDHHGIDGCGAPLFTSSVVGLARGFGQLGAATAGAPVAVTTVREPDGVTTSVVAAALGHVGRAMRAHPWAIEGIGGDDTIVMQELEGVVAKGGAEAVMGLGTADGHGVAVKVVDGSHRAAMVAALALAGHAGLDTSSVADEVATTVLGHGEPVGRVHPAKGLLT